MIHVQVPAETPLIRGDNGMRVFLVQDEEGDGSDTFPSVERAVQYIKDWMEADGDKVFLEVVKSPDDVGAAVKQFGEVIYHIIPLNFRMWLYESPRKGIFAFNHTLVWL